MREEQPAGQPGCGAGGGGGGGGGGQTGGDPGPIPTVPVIKGPEPDLTKIQRSFGTGSAGEPSEATRSTAILHSADPGPIGTEAVPQG